MKEARVRLYCALVIALLAWLVPAGGATAARASTTGRDAAKAKTFFTCVWHGQTIRMKHITNTAVQNLHDAVVAGQCTNFKTNDKYYNKLINKSINTFVAYREYPGEFVVHNALQGKQPVTGAWTFPIGAVPSASVQGAVKDKTSGQVLAGATVKAEHCGTSPTKHCITHTVLTNQFGHYFLQLYQSGAYTFSASSTGYATSTKKNVTVFLGQSSTMNYSLSSHTGSVNLSLTANPASGTVGQTTTLTATINKPVSDGTIAFTGTGPSGATFTSKTCTPASGICAVTWQPSAAGSWSITASWSGDSTYAAASATTQVTVTGGSTTVAVNAVPNPVQAGSATTLTVTLGSNISDGTVTVTGTGPSGATFPSKTCTPAAGTCQVSWTPTAAGSWTITAAWSGNASNQGSSGTTQVTVSQGTPTLTLAANPATPNKGQQTTLTATLSAPVSDGTVTFTGTGPSGATFATTSCVPSNGACTASWTPSQSGAWTITASWSGDASFSAATTSTQVTVSTQGTTVTLSVSPSSPGVNSPTTLTATLGSSLTGNVTFTGTGPNGATFSLTPLSCQTSNSTSCSVVWHPTAPGTWTITANFTGGNGISGASATTVSVPSQSTSLTVAASPTSPGIGSNVTLTATLGNSISDGTVTFTGAGPGGATFTKTCIPSSGSCTASWQPPAGGSWIVTAVWSGDATYGGLSANTTVNVTSGNTSLTLIETPNPLPPGTTGHVTATLGVSSINEGQIVFTFLGPGNASYTSQTCNPVNGTCAVTWSTSVTGDWVITAQWTGTSGTYQPAGNSIHVTVGTGTGITITQNPTPAIVNHAVQITSNLNASVNGGTVTVSITAPAGGTSPASQTCVPTSGACSVYFVPNVTGNWTVSAQYTNGSTTATQAGTVAVQTQSGLLNLVMSPNPVQTGTTVHFTATLPSTSADGSVSFLITFPGGGTTSSPIIPVAGGVATYDFTPTIAGAYSVTATWGGSTPSPGSATDTNTLIVVGISPTLTLTESPTTPNVGDNVTITSTISPTNIGGGTITFTATGPNNTTATVSPATCTPTAGSCTATWTPSVTGTWTVTATFSGYQQYAQVVKTLTVAVGSGFLNLSASPAVLQVGGSTTISLHFENTLSDGQVTFTFKNSDGTTANQQFCAAGGSNANGCTFTWTPPSTGTWTVTATLSNSASHPTQETDSTQVTVTGGILTVSAAPNPSSLSHPLDANGTVFRLTATLSQPITDNSSEIIFFITLPDQSVLSPVCYPQNGSCTVNIELGTANTPNQTGAYGIQAFWTGDNQLPSAQANTVEQVNS
jgi:hypothetical protein